MRWNEYPKLKDLDPVKQCAGQLHYINKAVTEGIAKVEEDRKQVVEYEDFCKNPHKVFDILLEKLEITDANVTYCGPERFVPTRKGNIPNCDIIKKAIASFISPP